MQGFAHLSPLQDIFPAFSPPLGTLQAADVFASSRAPGSLLASCPLSLACSDGFTLGDLFLGTVSQPFQAKSPSQSRSCVGIHSCGPKGPRALASGRGSIHARGIESDQSKIQMQLRNLRSKCSSVWTLEGSRQALGRRPCKREA